MDIVLASHNAGKLEEFRELFLNTPVIMHSLSDYCAEDAEETGLTFIENAILKARYGCQKTELPCIADDSGLVVPALQGAPGIYSARYAGVHGNMSANIEKLLNEMRDVPEGKRQAFFICVLVYMSHADDPTPLFAEGRCYGQITTRPSGGRGYGYDPVLFLPERNCTMAELSFQEKNKISHRGVAMQKLLEKLSLKC